MVIHKSSDFFFMFLFGWRPCPISTISNKLKSFAQETLLAQIKPTRFSSLSNLVITWGGCTPHLVLECLTEWATWKKRLLLMWALVLVFICGASFHKWSHSHLTWVFGWIIVFFSLHQSLEKGLLKTCAFIDAWSWRPALFGTLFLYSVNGHLGFLNFMKKLCSWCKYFAE
jgi:hypothetical protein